MDGSKFLVFKRKHLCKWLPRCFLIWGLALVSQWARLWIRALLNPTRFLLSCSTFITKMEYLEFPGPLTFCFRTAKCSLHAAAATAEDHHTQKPESKYTRNEKINNPRPMNRRNSATCTKLLFLEWRMLWIPKGEEITWTLDVVDPMDPMDPMDAMDPMTSGPSGCGLEDLGRRFDEFLVDTCTVGSCTACATWFKVSPTHLFFGELG